MYRIRKVGGLASGGEWWWIVLEMIVCFSMYTSIFLSASGVWVCTLLTLLGPRRALAGPQETFNATVDAMMEEFAVVPRMLIASIISCFGTMATWSWATQADGTRTSGVTGTVAATLCATLGASGVSLIYLWTKRRFDIARGHAISAVWGTAAWERASSPSGLRLGSLWPSRYEKLRDTDEAGGDEPSATSAHAGAAASTAVDEFALPRGAGGAKRIQRSATEPNLCRSGSFSDDELSPRQVAERTRREASVPMRRPPTAAAAPATTSVGCEAASITAAAPGPAPRVAAAPEARKPEAGRPETASSEAAIPEAAPIQERLFTPLRLAARSATAPLIAAMRSRNSSECLAETSHDAVGGEFSQRQAPSCDEQIGAAISSPLLRSDSLRRLALASTSEGRQRRTSAVSFEESALTLAAEGSAATPARLSVDHLPLIGLTAEEEAVLIQLKREASADML